MVFRLRILVKCERRLGVAPPLIRPTVTAMGQLLTTPNAVHKCERFATLHYRVTLP